MQVLREQAAPIAAALVEDGWSGTGPAPFRRYRTVRGRQRILVEVGELEVARSRLITLGGASS
jgi:hypothetical protein